MKKFFTTLLAVVACSSLFGAAPSGIWSFLNARLTPDHVDIVFPARAIDTGIPFMVSMRQGHLPNGIIDRDGTWVAKTMEDGGYAVADIDPNERKRVSNGIRKQNKIT